MLGVPVSSWLELLLNLLLIYQLWRLSKKIARLERREEARTFNEQIARHRSELAPRIQQMKEAIESFRKAQARVESKR